MKPVTRRWEINQKTFALKNSMHFCELLVINGLKQNLQYGPAWHSPGINWSKFRVFVHNNNNKKVRKIKKSIFALAENHPCKTDTCGNTVCPQGCSHQIIV